MFNIWDFMNQKNSYILLINSRFAKFFIYSQVYQMDWNKIISRYGYQGDLFDVNLF